MLLKIEMEKMFKELNENIGEEVEYITLHNGIPYSEVGYIYSVLDFQSLVFGGRMGGYYPLVGIRTAVVSVKLKNSGKILYENKNVLNIDPNLSDEDWHIEALRKTYGNEYVKEFLEQKEKNKQAKQNIKVVEEKKVLTEEEIELQDKMRLERSLEFVDKEVSANKKEVISETIRQKIYASGMLYIRTDRYEDWHNFVDRLFTCGECVTTLKAIVDIMSSLNDENCKSVINDTIEGKYGFLPRSLLYTIVNSLIYFSAYGKEIRKIMYSSDEQLEEGNKTKCKR